MNKLARKLSIFALSSVILLSNSKAGKFAEGQTYDLGEVGTASIGYYGINNDGSVEAFDVHFKDLKLDIDVYRKNDGIAYVLRNAGTVVSSGTIEHCENFRNAEAEYVLNILIKEIIEKDLPTFPRLIPSTMDETQKTPKHTKQKSENNNKHVAEKKPKKANQPEYRTITYKLPKGHTYDYQHGHCACDKPSPGKQAGLLTKIDGQNVQLQSYPCRTCCRPIRQSRENNKNCCWKTYCKECDQENEFYMARGTGNKRILICCSAYPFEIHEIAYANTAEFNAAVDQGKIKYICSKNPNHIRGHARKTSVTGGTQCLDCMNEAYAARKGKK